MRKNTILFKTLFIIQFIIVGSNFLFALDENLNDSLERFLKLNVKNCGKRRFIDFSNAQLNNYYLKLYLNKVGSLKTDTYNKFSKKEKLSFLINSYNAGVIDLLINHYPVNSVKTLGAWPLYSWNDHIIKILNNDESLINIERKIKTLSNDRRINFVLYNGSISSPDIPDTAINAVNYENQLNQAEKNYVFSNRNVRYIEQRKVLYLNEIFRINGKNFEEKKSTVTEYIASVRYNGKPKFNPRNVRVSFLKLNWSLADYGICQ